MILTSFGGVKHTKGLKDSLSPQHMKAIHFSERKTELQRSESYLRNNSRMGETEWTVTNHKVSSQFIKTTHKREDNGIKIGDK